MAVAFNTLKLHAATAKAISSVFKFTHMTPVQSHTLPEILKGKDVLAKARTGTGKTFAFLVPAIDRMAENPRARADDIDTLVISPTRELATQIYDEAEKLTTFHKNIRSMVLVGGVNKSKDMRALAGNPSIVIATPGRLIDHLKTTKGFAQRVNGVRTLILDEGDQLLDMGFKREIEQIVRFLPPNRQSLCFSATVPTTLKNVIHAALRQGYETIDCTALAGDVGSDVHDASKVPQEIAIVGASQLYEKAITAIAHEISMNPTNHKVMVFLPTARATGVLAHMLQNWTYSKKTSIGDTRTSVFEIHSRKSMPQRTRTAQQFKDADCGVLVSSDVSARGVDYPDVTLVLQVGIPSSKDQYVHRLGRTGRAGKTGRGLLMLAEYEKSFINTVKDLKFADATPVLNAHDAECNDNEIARASMKNVDAKLKAQAYSAWLGYYKGYAKQFNLSSSQLVELANRYAAEVLHLPEPPALSKQLVGKMGFKGVPGIRIESADQTKHARAASSRPSQHGAGRQHGHVGGHGLVHDGRVRGKM
ncbi:hypothetical protein SARC_04472 [Sphaeroforma arctica JP610]|uniref:ATP-dependent RNA helicase n=1 Tax=Sphaeroforma arctica JP610 TaxID=667725 RepID=A0A0L0G359_9EUKA|nr:hypothetical protein SARC_04472 [Sphaeroforma arctica JP610]KNC83276.1 hypothetical protein SARC_04472 [Sphaeroforma arctica JP610]|eukprot:XP_014157178.1 hypothetical protein SARC_04472 [Sphaeroforma arctica JP610]